MHDDSTHDAAERSARRGRLTAGGIGVAALVLLVAAGVAWTVLPQQPYIDRAPEKDQTIRELDLEMSVLNYRVPADRELAVWIEVYHRGELQGRFSPGIAVYPASHGMHRGEIRISRLDLGPPGDEESRLRLGIQITGNDTEVWTDQHIEGFDARPRGPLQVGRVHLSEDEPRVIWGYNYATGDQQVPAGTTGRADDLDAIFAQRSELALIARAKLRPPDEDILKNGPRRFVTGTYRGGYLSGVDVESLMGEELLERMRTAAERGADGDAGGE